MKGLVSIIIPCYNYGFVLAETLESLVKQKYTFWEAIIINDGSSDNTAVIAEAFARSDSRFTVLNQDNRGVSAARNLGLEYARGEYIQFLDADDLLASEKISSQALFLQNNHEIDICYGDSLYFNDRDAEKLIEGTKLPFPVTTPCLQGKGFPIINEFLRNSITISAPLVRVGVVKTVKGFNVDMKYVEDWDFWFRCALNNFSFYYLQHQNAFAQIRIHNSVSRDILSMRSGESVFRKRADLLIANSAFLLTEDKKKLLALNKKRKIRNYKYLLAMTRLSDYQGILTVFKELGPWWFFISFIKALNEKRKTYSI